MNHEEYKQKLKEIKDQYENIKKHTVEQEQSVQDDEQGIKNPFFTFNNHFNRPQGDNHEKS